MSHELDPDQGPEEPATDPGVRATLDKFEREVAPLLVTKKQLARGLNWSDAKSIVIAVAAVATALTAGWGRLEAYAQGKVDAGTQPIAKDVADLRVEVKELKADTKEQNNRMERKFDTVMMALRIPNPEPMPKDGGHP